jgi:hypothetical protein
MIDPDKIRAYIRDRADLNVLLNNEEQFDEEEMQIFELDIREEICLEIPALTPKKKTIPDIIIMHGVIARLLESVAHQENRNQMSISDDNVGQIDFSNKSEKYFSIANMYRSNMLRLASNMAAADYYNSMWGEVDMPSADYEFYLGGSE